MAFGFLSTLIINYPARAQSALARRARAPRALGLLLADGAPTVHNVYFVKYDVTVALMAQVLDTVTYFAGLDAPVVDTVIYFGGNHGSRV